MYIIKRTSYENGAYPPFHTWEKETIPSDTAIIPDDFDTSIFYEHNGFVFLTIENDVVTKMEANVEAWEAWKASLPEEVIEPTTEEILDAMLGVTE